MKLITSTTLKPRRKAIKIRAGISGPKWQGAEETSNGTLWVNTSFHSETEVTVAHRCRGKLTCAPSEFVCVLHCCGQYEAGLDGRLGLMLRFTGKYTFRLPHWGIHQMQAFQGVGTITILLGQGLHSSLDHMAVLQPAEMHILWIESLHMAGNCHHIQRMWRLGHSHCRGNCHRPKKADNYHKKFTMGTGKLPKDRGPLPRAYHRGVRYWLTNACISKCMSECMLGWKHGMMKPS